MRSLSLRVLVAGALLAPLALPAQGRGPGAPRPPRDSAGVTSQMGATQLLDARRELDLTPRQVAQLDSIERVQFARRRAFAERMRASQDSMMGGARQRPATPEARDSMRARMEARRVAQRPVFEEQRRADSTSRAAAMRLLNDAQRQRAREMVLVRQAEARGRMQAMRAGGGRAFAPGRGPGAGRAERGFRPGDRPRAGMRGERRFGPDGAPRMRAPAMPRDDRPGPRPPIDGDSLTVPGSRR